MSVPPAEKNSVKENVLASQLLHSENLHLKNLLNFLLLHDDWEYVTTRVTITNEHGAILLDAGTEHGIENDQLVVNNSGLIGKVVDVDKLSARLLPFNNKKFRIPVMIVEDRMKAIAVGNNSDYLQLLYLPVEAQEGSSVVTAGNNMPEIYVGQIIKNNMIKSSIDLKQIDFISIVKLKHRPFT